MQFYTCHLEVGTTEINGTYSHVCIRVFGGQGIGPISQIRLCSHTHSSTWLMGGGILFYNPSGIGSQLNWSSELDCYMFKSTVVDTGFTETKIQYKLKISYLGKFCPRSCRVINTTFKNCHSILSIYNTSSPLILIY